MSDWQRLRVATHDAKYTKASITRVSGEWLGIPACLDTSAPKSECHGSAVVFNYTTYFFQQVGIPQPFQASVTVYCILIGATMVSFYTVERFGRRTLILAGAIGCFIFNLVIASFGFAETSDAVNSAMLAMICLWVFTYAACFAGSCWTVAGEIATPRLRAKTLSFVVGTNAISGIIFNSAVPLMLSDSGTNATGWGVKTLYMFAILTAIGVVLNYIFLPETKGRTFAELDEMYEQGVPARHM